MRTTDKFSNAIYFFKQLDMQAKVRRLYNVTPNAKRRLALKLEFVRLGAKQCWADGRTWHWELAQRWECGRQLEVFRDAGLLGPATLILYQTFSLTRQTQTASF
jgi:hypothetical protein